MKLDNAQTRTPDHATRPAQRRIGPVPPATRAGALLTTLRSLDEAGVRTLNALICRSALLRSTATLIARRFSAVEVVLMLLLGVSGRPRAAARMLLAVGVIYALFQLAGQHWSRVRPFARLSGVECLLVHEAGRSFPSRHVASAFAMAGIATPARPAVGRLMSSVAWALAVSRVGAGLHYPSDAVAGGLIGVVVGRVLRA